MLHTFVGNLVEAPTFQTTERGVASTRLRLAVNESYRDRNGERREKEATFWDCYAWGTRAERIRDASWGQGTALVVVGEFQASTWGAEDGTKRSRTTVTILHAGVDVTRTRGARIAAQDAPEELPGLGAVNADAEVGL
ncbi:MAG: single-stranded DNA-binding protein [Schaalia hyovaginalis]|uniref:single-stranded DNA-binding protein n=1 Tax=Schaalia hyovaginalis TaxID=29316 RepID=UPI002A91F0F9|nr:single-stranded DNA-binding protein [Schaalia hyovaginalis]MDY6213500.1 single-stranded DNA-binding protein [Schaalia hyovaginalis]